MLSQAFVRRTEKVLNWILIAIGFAFIITFIVSAAFWGWYWFQALQSAGL